MMPQVTTHDGFTVLGVPSRIRRGSESPELFGRIWQAFEGRRAEIAPAVTRQGFYGVSFPTNEGDVTDYLAGVAVAAGTPASDCLTARDVPGGEYAVFECPVEAIGATYQYIFGEWLPTAAVEYDTKRPSFEEYQENTPPQPVRLYIPVRH